MAGTFKAMANGMQIADDTGTEMAKTLTELAADMASFYNVSVDVAQTALNSVFTGETESLKKFGVVMTEANLNAYALANGLEEISDDMSQSEKVALRYQYVLQSLSTASRRLCPYFRKPGKPSQRYHRNALKRRPQAW